MFTKSSPVYLFAILCTLMVTPAQAALQRAFVASYGNDANSCILLSPCLKFAKAVTVVDPNGEVVALDSGGFGPVTLTQPISLTAAPGVHAGISVSSGSGVTIASNVDVVLRGLTINGLGGNNGILMSGSSSLSIENCVISNFSGGGQRGVFVSSAASVRMVDTLIRDNDTGIQLQGGAITDISGSKFLGNNTAILASSTSSPLTSVTISDTVVTAGGTGIEAISSGTGSSLINMIRTSVTNNLKGVASSASTPGAAPVTLSDSMIAGNVVGYFVGAGGLIRSLVNNSITDTNNSGSLTPLGLQ